MSLAWEVVATFLHRPPAEFVWSILDGHGPWRQRRWPGSALQLAVSPGTWLVIGAMFIGRRLQILVSTALKRPVP